MTHPIADCSSKCRVRREILGAEDLTGDRWVNLLTGLKAGRYLVWLSTHLSTLIYVEYLSNEKENVVKSCH